MKIIRRKERILCGYLHVDAFFRIDCFFLQLLFILMLSRIPQQGSRVNFNEEFILFYIFSYKQIDIQAINIQVLVFLSYSFCG